MFIFGQNYAGGYPGSCQPPCSCMFIGLSVLTAPSAERLAGFPHSNAHVITIPHCIIMIHPCHLCPPSLPTSADVATLGALSRYTAGQVYHYPAFNPATPDKDRCVRALPASRSSATYCCWRCIRLSAAD